MRLRQIFIFVLCLWLPLQVSAAHLAGCSLVKMSMAQASDEGQSHHCDHKGKTGSHVDCNYCKSQCSGSIVIFTQHHSTALFSKREYWTIHYPSPYSVYLDQPQRPPQAAS